MIEHFLSGAIVIAAAVIAAFFWRFRRETRDPLFGCFAVAFLLLGVERVCIEFLTLGPRSLVFMIRLAAFLLILFAITNKNRNDTTGI
ncbi:MAG TPA: DUF5985 family protein [Verrucomicrobiae bacterium]|jgi:hypothetical protein